MRPCSNYGLRICIGVCFTGHLVLVSLPLDFNTLPNSATSLTKHQKYFVYSKIHLLPTSPAATQVKEKFVASDRSDKSIYLPLWRSCVLPRTHYLNIFEHCHVTYEKAYYWEVWLFIIVVHATKVLKQDGWIILSVCGKISRSRKSYKEALYYLHNPP